MLAVTVLAAIPNFGLIFEDYYLRSAAILLGSGQDSGAFDDRITDGYVIAIGNHHDPVQLQFTAFVYRQTLDIYSLAFGDLILFSACFNNSVNFGPPNVILYHFQGWPSIVNFLR
jgi:hypothetical protein